MTAEIEANTAKFFDDLEAIRLSPEDTAGLGSKEILIRIPVRRPKKQEFVRCHPDPQMTLAVTLYVDDDDGEAYFVAPGMRGALAQPGFAQRRFEVGIFPVLDPASGKAVAFKDRARLRAAFRQCRHAGSLTNWS